ncbi:MAG: hypothetical protein SGJ00_09655 [bacterium]|nr:hypothetical protein [bacterium]
MKKLYLIVIAFTLFAVACKKDLNFDKFNDLTLSPEFGIPLAVVEVKMSDIIKQDSNIKYDPDGFIRFIQRQDSVASFPADSFVVIPPVAPLTVNNTLGVINIEDINVNQAKTLGDLSTSFSANTKAALDAVTGQVAIFPAITDQNPAVTELAMSSAQFDNVSLSNGYLVMEFRNELPVTIDEIRVNLYNTTPFQFFLNQLIFRNVAPNSSKKDSISMTNVTLSSGLGYSLPVFKTFASSSPVLVNVNDKIKFDIVTRDLKAYAGAAIFPTQTINPQVLNVDLKADDPAVRIRTITFDAGKINYNVSSNIEEKLQLKINIVGATKNGNVFPPILIEVDNNTKIGSVDLSNVMFDLSNDVGQPYNKIKVEVEPKLISSNQIKNFDSSDYVNATFTFDNLAFKEINGYLGTKEIKIEPSVQTLDFLDQFESGFPLDDPRIRIFTSNSIGVPVDVTLDALGTSAKGVSQSLNAPAFTIGYPTTAQKGQIVNDTKVIDKNNSSIVAMLNLPPKTISFSGKAKINAAGFTGYNDFIAKGGGVAVGYEVEMPLSLKTNNLIRDQYIKNPFFESLNNGDSLGKSVLGIDAEDMEYLDLLLKTDNGIPFEANLDLYFANGDSVIQDTILIGNLMRSAIPDANGRTAQNVTTIAPIRLTSEKLAAIKAKNLTLLMIRITISTFNNGSTPVKIYSDYKAKIGLSAKVKLKIKLKK